MENPVISKGGLGKYRMVQTGTGEDRQGSGRGVYIIAPWEGKYRMVQTGTSGDSTTRVGGVGSVSQTIASKMVGLNVQHVLSLRLTTW